MRSPIHQITCCAEWQQRWLNLSRWVLVKAPIKLWLALTIDFSQEHVASLKMPVHHTQHCGKAIKLKSCLPLQILRLTNNSSFSAPINMTQTSSLLHRNIFSLQRWLEWTPVFRRSAQTDCENVNQSRWMAPGLFPGKSHQCRTVVSLQEALEMVVLQRRIGGVEPEGADVVWGSPKLPPSIWGGGAGYNTNAYLNDHFAFIYIHLKIK